MFHAHSPAPATAGQIVLGRYRLGPRLGAGGMGVVYRARDEHLERDVAVKRIAIGHDPDGRGEREALAAARLSHAGIVALFESGRDDDAVYLVSELVEGPTLADLLRDGALSDRDVLRVGATLCAALAHAHKRGVIHRDVKPSNVICPEADAGLGTAKLTDFGIARMADHDVLTRTGDIIGTLAYMAPEQARGEKITAAVDVYALGVVLYEALAGVNPIRAGNPAATARRVGMRLAPLHRVRRDLPVELCRAIDAAVAVEPQARTTLAALRRALEGAVDAVGDVAGPVAGGTLDTLALPVLTRTRTRLQRPRGCTACAARSDASRPHDGCARSPAAQVPAAVPVAVASAAPAPEDLERRPRPAPDRARAADPRRRGGRRPRRRGARAPRAAAAAGSRRRRRARGRRRRAAAAHRLAAGGRRARRLARRADPRPRAARRLRGRARAAPARAPRPDLVAARGRAAAGRDRPRGRLAGAGRAGAALAGARRARRARRLVGRPRRGADIATGSCSARRARCSRAAPGRGRRSRPRSRRCGRSWPAAASGSPRCGGSRRCCCRCSCAGRSAALDLVGVAGWAAALAAATQALSEALVLDPAARPRRGRARGRRHRGRRARRARPRLSAAVLWVRVEP